MTSGSPRVSHRIDRQPISDDGIRDLLRRGWFNNQIRMRYIASFARIRKIDRELRGAA